MTVHVQSLGSGSSGNALLIRASAVTALVDFGLSPRELRAMLASVSCAVEDIDVALVTHEHGDHARGLPALLQAECPIVATGGTAAVLGIPEKLRVGAPDDQEIDVGALRVRILPTSHDAVEPCGFAFEVDGVSCTVLTDLGKPAPQHSAWLRSSDLVVIEANHDRARLRNGPYPMRLKQRVASDEGHLSNQACAQWLGEALKGTGRQPDIWLAHLSQVNNLPLLAQEIVEKELQRSGIVSSVTPLPRRTVGPIWDIQGRGAAMRHSAVQLRLSLS